MSETKKQPVLKVIFILIMIGGIAAAFLNKRTEEKKVITPVKYQVLRDWQPNNDPTGMGQDIFLEEQIPEKEIIDWIKRISLGKDPVMIRVYLSIECWKDEHRVNKDPIAKLDPKLLNDFLLVYQKNLSGQGENQIAWMQDLGKYAHLSGTKTQL